MSFFDFHHHDSGKNFGIYKLKFRLKITFLREFIQMLSPMV